MGRVRHGQYTAEFFLHPLTGNLSDKLAPLPKEDFALSLNREAVLCSQPHRPYQAGRVVLTDSTTYYPEKTLLQILAPLKGVNQLNHSRPPRCSQINCPGIHSEVTTGKVCFYTLVDS